MTKKAFTLVELLAVIVILGIILVIAVPKVINVIDISKSKISIINHKSLINAAEKYFIKNVSLLPINVGDSIQISVVDLNNEGYIKTIKSPYDKTKNCSGYVVILKTSPDTFEYTPNINCINTVNNLSEDGLAAHYTFDDFKEPTENYFTNGNFANGNDVVNMRGSNPINEVINMTNPGSTEWLLRQTSVGGSPNTEYEIHFKTGKLIEKNSTYTMSCLVGYTSDWNGYDNIFHTRGYYSDGLEFTTNGGGNTIESFNMGNITWNYRYYTFTTGNKDISLDYPFNWYLGYPANNTSGFRYITNIQLEKKAYATPFVDGVRDDYVMDYSGNKKNGTLSLENTPKWIEDNKRGGVYSFDGVDDFISFIKPTINNSITVSAWVNYNSSISGEISNGDMWDGGPYSGWRLNANSFKVGDGTNTNYVVNSNISISPGNWYHIVGTYKSGELKIYHNGKLSNTNNVNLTYSNGSGSHYVGKYAGSAYYLNGKIDDIRIYNRALSAEEIKHLYDIEKK